MKYLIIDSNYICHSVYHSLPTLSFGSRGTSIIFGFMKRLISFASQFPSSKMIFVWDSVDSIRKEVYPDYKKVRAGRYAEMTAGEKRDKEGAHRQFTEIREVALPLLGFKHIYSQEGYEADDLMASITMNNDGHEFIIITTDQDIYQLIDDHVMLYNPASKSIQTVNTFTDEFGCHPNMWGQAKAIAGCSTDNVSGVVGVAEKTAIKYLTKKLSDKTKAFKNIEAAHEMIEENKELVILPMHGTRVISIEGKDELSRQNFIHMCEKYGFQSLLTSKSLSKWDSIL